jgi:hypothetical protein
MEQAIIALDDALADYLRHVDLVDVTEERTAPALAQAAAVVLDKWDFDRGIPRS